MQHIAHFVCQAGLPLNTCHLDSFKEIIEAIGRYGEVLKSLIYYEL